MLLQMFSQKFYMKFVLAVLILVSIFAYGCLKKRYKNVTVEVQRFGTNDPVPGIVVELLHKNAGFPESGVSTVMKTAVTNSEGKATFKNLPSSSRFDDY